MGRQYIKLEPQLALTLKFNCKAHANIITFIMFEF